MQLAFFGGVYNNHLALEAAIADARGREVDRMYCLGDLGAFGPYPDRVFPLLIEHDVTCLQGNYDHSIGNDVGDCQCGYTDPRDNHFAQISYEYTYKNTNKSNRAWMRDLPAELRFEVDGLRFLLCHGSPRRTNEFLWESTTSTAFLNKLADDFDADVILGTHTGIHWERELGGGRRFINVGCLGRPENDGTTNVWYVIVRTGDDAARDAGCGVRDDRVRSTEYGVPSTQNSELRTAYPLPRTAYSLPGTQYGALLAESEAERTPAPNAASPVLQHASHIPHPVPPIAVDFIPLAYDHERLACEMRDERLPDEFVETILTGWWTTCMEVLPAKERRRGKF